MKKKELDTLMSEALDNIRDDRKVAREFLNEIATQISLDAEKNRHLSPVAAQHVQSLQRSNEQLVKLISLKQKSIGSSPILSEADKDSLFDLIQGDEPSNVS